MVGQRTTDAGRNLLAFLEDSGAQVDARATCPAGRPMERRPA
jgi:hypothetical protein